MSQELLDQANRDLNAIFTKMMHEAGYGSRMPRWTHYKHGPIAFCYNTEPFTVDRDQPRRWAAWRYRVNKQRGTWKRVGKKVWFAKRKKAAARALKWYQKAKAKP